MKIVASASALILLTLGVCHANSELDELAKQILQELSKTEWQITQDWMSITVTRTNVQFMNPINLPALESEDVLWRDYSFTSDFRITIELDTRMSKAEYDKASRLQHTFNDERSKGRKGKDVMSPEGLVSLRLPRYYWGRFSVYVYSSDFGFFDLRPTSVKVVRDKVIGILDSTCSKYRKDSEPGAPPNRSRAMGSR